MKKNAKNKLENFYVIKKMLKTLLNYDLKGFIILIIITTTINILPYISIILTQQLLNSIQLQSSVEVIFQLLFLYLIVKFSGLIFNTFYSYISKKYNDYLTYKLSIDFLQKVQYMEYKDFENDKTYDLLLRANQQIGTAPALLISNILSLIGSIMGLFTSIIILIKWHVWIVIGFIILPVISFKYFVLLNKQEYEVVMKRTPLERLSWYYSQLLIKDYFIKEIKTLGASSYISHKFNQIKEKIFKENLFLNKKRTIYNFLYQLLNLLFSSFVVVVSIIEVIYGKILIGNFMTYINTISRVENTIMSITSAYYSIYTNSLYFANVINFYEYAEKKKNEKSQNKIDINEIKSIKIDNLSFGYPNSKSYALKNISFEMTENEIVAIVGENGSGKSTLLKILTGLYQDYTGNIYINGINLKEIDELSLLRRMSVIFQDFNNYEFTVKDNIGIGDIENIDNIERIKKVSQLSGADSFIEKMTMKYDQQLGNWFPKGVQISGGQWQKIAISRVLMKDADIYILDEPTSSLDPSSEYNFLNDFTKHTKKSMSIFATHRFINAKIANKIIVLKNGQLVEIGNHSKLIQDEGEYSRLFKLQVEGGV